jgi:hypothetical protein
MKTGLPTGDWRELKGWYDCIKWILDKPSLWFSAEAEVVDTIK